MLDEIVAAQPLAVWAERFDAEGVWWAPAQGPADVLDDPQLAATAGFVEVCTPDGSPIGRTVNGPVTFADSPRREVPRHPGSASTPKRCWPSSNDEALRA